MPSIYSKLIEHAESIIPTDFYDVREEIHPKAGWYPMFGLTTVVYIASTIAFVLLFINEQQNTSIETIITGYDYDGQDGYTCQMISYASATVSIISTADPSMEYNLVDVMESKTECQTNFEQADPCNSQPLAFFPGNKATQMSDTAGQTFGAVAQFGDDSSLFWTSLPSSNPYISTYNSSYGKKDQLYYQTPDDFSSMKSLAVDVDGNLLYISKDSQNFDNSPMLVYRSSTTGDFPDEVYDTEQFDLPILLNDNLYNIYMILNNTFSVLNLDEFPATSTELFALDVGTNILGAAVYHDGASPVVYYFIDDAFLWTYQDGAANSTAWYDSQLKGLAVDGANTLYGLSRREYQNELIPGEFFITHKINATASFSCDVGSDLAPPVAFGINPSGNRIMVTKTTPEGPQLGYAYPKNPDFNLGNTLEIVMQQSGFAGGFFMCENQVVSPTAYTPGVVAEYPQSCETNGIEGKIVYNQQYNFNNVDMQTFATTNAVQFCPNLFAPIVAKVSKLPPYSCSRTLHQSFLSCFGSAFANMTFLMQLMVFACAMWLPRLAERYPVEEETEERKSVAHRKSVLEKRKSAVQANDAARETNDVEMSAVGGANGTDNPMQRKL